MGPAAAIAGRTRSRTAAFSTNPSSPSAKDRDPPGVGFRGRKRREVVIVLDGAEEGAAVPHGHEGSGGGPAADGRRPPLERLPVASRTRSKRRGAAAVGCDGRPLVSVPLASRSRSKLCPVVPVSQPLPPAGGSRTGVWPSDSRPGDGLEPGGSRGSFHVRSPYVSRKLEAMLSSLGVSEVSDDESSEEEEEEEEVAVDEESPLPPLSPAVVADGEGEEGEGEGEGEGGGFVVDASAVPVQRKRFSGIEVLVPLCGSASLDDPGIAKRTRSHFTSEFKRQWQRQPGTLSSPYCVDMDFSDSGSKSDSSSSSHSHQRDDDDSIHLHRSTIGNAREQKGGGPKEGKPKSKEPSEGKQRGRRPMGGNYLTRFLLDAILENDEKPRESLAQSREGEVKLPLVFSFGDEDPKPVEKSEFEEAMDCLWSDFDFAMRVDELGREYTGEEDEINTSQTEAVPSGHCSQGKHSFILDEQIGVICQHCSFVELEIRYVPPTFAKYCFATWDRRTFTDDVSVLETALHDETANDKFDSSMVETTGTIWDLIPGAKGPLFPHQREGLEFIWRNIAGGIHINNLKDSMTSDTVRGCVINHAPGTGKTRLAIVFLQTFLKAFPRCRPVILAPRGMLLTWEEEFKKWDVGFPFHVLNGEGASNGSKPMKTPDLLRGRRPVARKFDRHVKLHLWATQGDSVLGISYGLFERLAGKCFNKGTDGEKWSRILLELPGLFIFDEGHTPRNERSFIWQALQNIKTKCRVILSGTPFQNNLRELENVLCLVRPDVSGKVSSRTRKNTRPRTKAFTRRAVGGEEEQEEEEEPFLSPTPANSYTHETIEGLRSMIAPFVHLHGGSVLEDLLGLRDCLIFLNPSRHQKDLLRRVQKFPRSNYLDYECKASLASVHPCLLGSARLSPEEESVLGHHLLETLRDENLLLNPNEGVKTRFVRELVRLSGSLGEKVLVFSQYIEPLGLIREQLLKGFGWDEGKVLKMDGGIALRDRQSYIDAFNSPSSEVQVLLASIKACSEGISLVGASRVVLLDTVWNPSVERQAISRAYRLGQKRVVFTYHLITAETGEFDKYQRQAEKDRISNLVFPSQGRCEPGEGGGPSRVPEDRILREMREHEKLRDMFKHVMDKPKEALLLNAFDPWPSQFSEKTPGCSRVGCS